MNTFSNIITGIGFSTMIGGFIYVGRKLQVLDDMKVAMDKMNKDLKLISDFVTNTRD